MNDFQCSDLFIWVIIAVCILILVWLVGGLLTAEEKKPELPKPPSRFKPTVSDKEFEEFQQSLRARMERFEKYVIDAEYKYKKQLELEQGLRAELTFYVYQDKKTKNFQLSLKPINRANLELYSKFQQNVWKGQIWEE